MPWGEVKRSHVVRNALVCSVRACVRLPDPVIEQSRPAGREMGSARQPNDSRSISTAFEEAGFASAVRRLPFDSPPIIPSMSCRLTLSAFIRRTESFSFEARSIARSRSGSARARTPTPYVRRYPPNFPATRSTRRSSGCLIADSLSQRAHPMASRRLIGRASACRPTSQRKICKKSPFRSRPSGSAARGRWRRRWTFSASKS